MKDQCLVILAEVARSKQRNSVNGELVLDSLVVYGGLPFLKIKMKDMIIKSPFQLQGVTNAPDFRDLKW